MAERLNDDEFVEDVEQTAVEVETSGQTPNVVVGNETSTVVAALDQITHLVNEARVVPLSANVLLNKAEVLDLVDQAHTALPYDIVTAHAVVQDANAVLSRAESTAAASLAEAEAKAQANLTSTKEQQETILREAQDQADKTIANANEEAKRIVSKAKQDAQGLVSEHQVTVAAKAHAESLLQDADQEARKLKAGANEYTAATLTETAKLLSEFLARTEAGIRKVEDSSSGQYQPGSLELD